MTPQSQPIARKPALGSPGNRDVVAQTVPAIERCGEPEARVRPHPVRITQGDASSIRHDDPFAIGSSDAVCYRRSWMRPVARGLSARTLTEC